VSNPSQFVPQPTAQVIVTPVGVVPAAPPPPEGADTQADEAKRAAADNLLKAETQAPPDRGRPVEIGQGLYYLVIGLWPLLSAESFQHVTGPRLDLWMTRTLGLVIATVGVALLVAMRRRSVAPEAAVMAIGVATVLGVTDLINVSLRTVGPIYGLDFIIQAAFVYIWVRALTSTTDAVHLVRR